MKLQHIFQGQVYALTRASDPWAYRTDSEAVLVADATGQYKLIGGGGSYRARITKFGEIAPAQRRLLVIASTSVARIEDHLDELRTLDIDSLGDLQDGDEILDGRFRIRAVRAQSIVTSWDDFTTKWDALAIIKRKQHEDADARAKALTEGRKQVEADLASKGLTGANVDMQSGRVLVNLKQLQDLLAAK